MEIEITIVVCKYLHLFLLNCIPEPLIVVFPGGVQLISHLERIVTFLFEQVPSPVVFFGELNISHGQVEFDIVSAIVHLVVFVQHVVYFVLICIAEV